jgi:hypothetical protein
MFLSKQATFQQCHIQAIRLGIIKGSLPPFHKKHEVITLMGLYSFVMEADTPKKMRFRTPNIILACLLAVSTLWLSQTMAAHIHLDDNNIHCELCLSSSPGETSLENNPSDFPVELLATDIVASHFTTPQLTPVAPHNSRAPPTL